MIVSQKSQFYRKKYQITDFLTILFFSGIDDNEESKQTNQNKLELACGDRLDLWQSDLNFGRILRFCIKIKLK